MKISTNVSFCFSLFHSMTLKKQTCRSLLKEQSGLQCILKHFAIPSVDWDCFVVGFWLLFFFNLDILKNCLVFSAKI